MIVDNVELACMTLCSFDVTLSLLFESTSDAVAFGWNLCCIYLINNLQHCRISSVERLQQNV